MADFQIKNKIDSSCAVCGVEVLKYEGLSSKDEDDKWFTVCASKHCIEDRGLTPPEEQKRTLNADGEVSMEYDPKALPLLRSMPGAQWNSKKKVWTVSTAPEDRIRVLELAEKLGLEVADEIAEVPKDDVVEELLEQGEEAGLYPFQLEGVNWLARRNYALLGDDMGLGKTVQVLMSLRPSERVLAVVPACVKYNWRDEAHDWRSEFDVDVIDGRGNCRPPEEGEIVIVNYDILPRNPYKVELAELLSMLQDAGGTSFNGEDIRAKSLKEEDFKSVIDSLVEGGAEVDELQEQAVDRLRKKDETFAKEVEEYDRYEGILLLSDESHLIKNYKAQRTQKFGDLAQRAEKVWELTGTPLMNTPPDLWGVLDAGGMARRVFGSWGKFTNLFNGYKNRWGGYEWGRPDDEVSERLRRVMLRRTKDEVLPELPQKTYKTLAVNGINSAVTEEMDELWDRWQGVIEGGELPDFEEFSRIREKLARDRIPAVEEFVESYEDAGIPLLVFSAHRAPIDHLHKRKGWTSITGDTPASKRQEIVKEFQSGKLKGLALTIEAGGVGLTLTRASHILFVDLEWRPSDNAQAEDRVRRIGQDADNIQIIRMVADHVLDRHVLKLLAEKQRLFERAIEKEIEYTAPDDGEAFAKDEDERAWRERVEAFKKAEEEARKLEEAERRKSHRDRVEKILDRQRERAESSPGYVKEPREITEELYQTIVDAHQYMLSVCDGAIEEDAKGFNKPDAMTARIITEYDMDDEVAVRAIERMLVRYHRQLSHRFPLLFEDSDE